MWESRPLPKIIRKPPSPLSAQGGLLLSALCCRACKTPQVREFPNQPSASYIPPSLLHLALNRTDLENTRGRFDPLSPNSSEFGAFFTSFSSLRLFARKCSRF